MPTPSDYPTQALQSSDYSLGWMHGTARDTVVPMLFEAMQEPVAVHVTAASESDVVPKVLPAVVRVTSQDRSDTGQSIVSSASLLFRVNPQVDGEYAMLSAMRRLSFRGQHFTVTAVGPLSPDGTFTVTAENAFKVFSNSPKLNSRR